MKSKFAVIVLVCFVSVASGCVGFWTVVCTAVYMKSRKHHTVTVQLKSEPVKIYAAMLRATEKNKVEVKKADESKFLIEGVKGNRFASVYVETLGKGISQLIVTVDAGEENKPEEEIAFEIVKNVCTEVGEKCESKL